MYVYLYICSYIDTCIYLHCVKSVRIRSYSGPYFPAFGLNSPYLSGFSPNAGNTDQNNSEYGHFLRSDIYTYIKYIYIYIYI